MTYTEGELFPLGHRITHITADPSYMTTYICQLDQLVKEALLAMIGARLVYVEAGGEQLVGAEHAARAATQRCARRVPHGATCGAHSHGHIARPHRKARNSILPVPDLQYHSQKVHGR